MAWVRREYGKRQKPRTKSTHYPDLFCGRFRPEYRANRAAWCWTRQQLREMYQEEGLSPLQAGRKTKKLYGGLLSMDQCQIPVARRWGENTYLENPGMIERFVSNEEDLWRIIDSMNFLGPRWRKSQRRNVKMGKKRADLAEWLELVLSRE